MPSKTPKQQRAMYAAAAGKSNIGIPVSVGKDFVAADKAKAKQKPKRRMTAPAKLKGFIKGKRKS